MYVSLKSSWRVGSLAEGGIQVYRSVNDNGTANPALLSILSKPSPFLTEILTIKTLNKIWLITDRQDMRVSRHNSTRKIMYYENKYKVLFGVGANHR